MADTFASIFAESTGRAFVEAFAARTTLAMAKGVQSSETLRLKWDLRVEQAWAVACLLILWYQEKLPRKEADAVKATFADVDMRQINLVLAPLAGRIVPFLAESYGAKSNADLAKAGVYFRAAIEWLGPEALHSAFEARAVSVALAKIKAKLPPLPNLDGAYLEALGATNTSVQKVVQPDASGRPIVGAVGRKIGRERADRFERFDKPVRESPALPPVLEPSERLTAHLYTRGWKPEDIERITKGPRGS